MKPGKIVMSIGTSLVLLASCGGPSTPAPSETLDALKGMKQIADVAQTVQSGTAEDVANSVEKFAELGATFEVKEFEKTESVDAPANFPADLLYKNGKITSASDNSSDENNISQDVEIKTLDPATTLRDFYKKALAANGWKLKRQTNNSGGANYSAEKEDGSSANVSISSNQYSKLTTVRIDYSKYAQ